MTQWHSSVDRVTFPANIQFGFLERNIAPPQATHFANQVHGITTVAAGTHTADDSQARCDADSVVACRAGDIVAVKTADCLPVLFAASGLVAAAHAGWRGLFAGILQSTINKLEDLGAQHRDVLVAIGPSISTAHFEVGPEVVAALRRTPIGASEADVNLCLLKGKADRWHIDLQMAACLLLQNAGIKADNIQVVRCCTFADQRFASYRRNGSNAGRNWSFIGLC